jgi:hypothetical protein
LIGAVAFVIAAAVALSGCVPLAAGVVGYEVGKTNCWRQPAPVVYPDGRVYVPPPVNVCALPLGLE